MLSINTGVGGCYGRRGVPVFEDDVYIGTGARLLGLITIGRGAQIGANAVVLTDVPDAAVFAGIPARLVRKSDLQPVLFDRLG